MRLGFGVRRSRLMEERARGPYNSDRGNVRVLGMMQGLKIGSENDSGLQVLEKAQSAEGAKSPLPPKHNGCPKKDAGSNVPSSFCFKHARPGHMTGSFRFPYSTIPLWMMVVWAPTQPAHSVTPPIRTTTHRSQHPFLRTAPLHVLMYTSALTSPLTLAYSRSRALSSSDLLSRNTGEGSYWRMVEEARGRDLKACTNTGPGPIIRFTRRRRCRPTPLPQPGLGG